MRQRDERRRELQQRTQDAFRFILSDESVAVLPPERLREVVDLVRETEFTIAFDLLAAILAQSNRTPSAQALERMREIAERHRIKPENWHGLNGP
jgi:hypothetical protein